MTLSYYIGIYLIFVLSGVNKTSVLYICLCYQVLRPALMHVSETWQRFGIKGLKMTSYSHADYYVDLKKKAPVFITKRGKQDERTNWSRIC